MSQCLSADAIIGIGDALNWDVAEGLQHLQTCEECGARLEVLRITRSGFVETEPVDGAVLRQISEAVGMAARHERQRARVRERWIQSIEALMAGVTALIILISSDVSIDSIGTAALAFLLGATLMVCGRLFARNVSAFAQEGARV
jgi:hypothetical protein